MTRNSKDSSEEDYFDRTNKHKFMKVGRDVEEIEQMGSFYKEPRY